MRASGCGEGKSSAVTFTSSAPLMFSPLRAYSLMPLVTVRPVSEAAEQTRAVLDKMDLPELRYFCENFLGSFALTLDEME